MAMHNLALIEEKFKEFYKNIGLGSSELLIPVNLSLLHHMELLCFHSPWNKSQSLTRYFQLIESNGKLTLINEDFVVWIAPENAHKIPLTYTMIALNYPAGPKLELIFSAAGVYNTSRTVLRVLEKFLYEIQENEEYLKSIK
ncbi:MULTISPECIES: hypothetical protein [unclassified Neochlamydia]|uniref:hypothetical protein n=1 Tax=unclassified Neochlamydia TaxID=2643326 RepID=UPI001F61FF6D|nr:MULTISPECIES: hypothetical protein [unclassified Neochlamydia]NGY95470.1 hypothetical protein [Neochlamydia sp. AcF84]